MTRFVLRLTALLVAMVLGSAALAAVAGPTDARSGTPPVTAPDTVTVFPVNYAFPEVLANDSDADGDRLTVCGLGPEKYPRIQADADKRYVSLRILTRAKPGTYPITYYACDGTARTPGTLTVVVAKPPKIKVRPVRGAHGRVKASTNASFKVRLTYGNYARDDAEGTVTIPRHGSVVFSTRYHTIEWLARTADDMFLSRGHVRYVP